MLEDPVKVVNQALVVENLIYYEFRRVEWVGVFRKVNWKLSLQDVAIK